MADPTPSSAPPDPAIALFLSTRDVPCPNPTCGFNLKGLTAAACPECGEPLRLTIRRSEALWHMRKLVVFAAALLLVGAAFESGQWIDFLVKYTFRPNGWWVSASMPTGVAVSLAITLTRYAIQSRKKDPRALPRLLKSCLLATMIYGLYHAWEVVRIISNRS